MRCRARHREVLRYPGAALQLRSVVRPETIVLSLQAGIENDEILAAGIGMPPLMRAVADLAAELVDPGLVRQHRGGHVIFGEPDGRRSERAEQLAGLWFRAGITQELSTDIAAVKWTKLAWDAAFNAVTALNGCTIGEAVAHPKRREMVRTVMHEVIAVANASGVPLDPAYVDPEIDQSAAELGRLRTPMLQDIERGWRLEIDALNGAVVRAAARVGVNAPVNALLYRVLKLSDDMARRRLRSVGTIT